LLSAPEAIFHTQVYFPLHLLTLLIKIKEEEFRLRRYGFATIITKDKDIEVFREAISKLIVKDN